MKKTLNPRDPKLHSQMLRDLKELKRGKPAESIKGLHKVDLRFYQTAEGARSVRKGLGITQEKFAKAMGVSVVTVRAWEASRKRPRGLVAKIFKVIEMHPKVLDMLAAA